MSEPAKLLNPNDLVVDADRKTMTGYAPDGSVIEIDPNGDDANAVEGLDGSPVFSDIIKGYWLTKVRTLQTSDFNDILQKAFAEKRFFPFSVRDLNGRLICSTPAARVKKRPVVKYGGKADVNEWEIYCVYGKLEILGSKAAV